MCEGPAGSELRQRRAGTAEHHQPRELHGGWHGLGKQEEGEDRRQWKESGLEQPQGSEYPGSTHSGWGSSAYSPSDDSPTGSRGCCADSSEQQQQQQQQQELKLPQDQGQEQDQEQNWQQQQQQQQQEEEVGEWQHRPQEGRQQLHARSPFEVEAAAAGDAAASRESAEVTTGLLLQITRRLPVKQPEEQQWQQQLGQSDLRQQQGSLMGDGSMSFWELVTDTAVQVYFGVHFIALLTLVYVPCSPRLLAIALASYNARMFGITAGYHRLLSHRSFKTSRPMQFLLALLGCSAFQKGPLWWASHHRHHHRKADTEEDAHSPVQWGFMWSHVGWFLFSSKHTQVLWGSVPDLAAFPELQLLERFHYVPPLLLGAVLWAVWGLPAMAWGFMVSTVACWHCTYCINSLAHLVGSRRFRCEFNTHCDARNNLWLALATLGEGWHNNHHCYMRSAKHGFYKHEVDVTWYVLLLMRNMGLVWDLELPPLAMLEARRFDDKHLRCRCKAVDNDMAEILRADSSVGCTPAAASSTALAAANS